MKKQILLLAFVLFSVAGFGQNNTSFVFFSEDGNPFTLYLNGVQINPTPQTNLRVNNVNGMFYQMRLLVGNGNDEISQKIFPQPGLETTMSVKRNRKGKYVLRFRSAAAMSNDISGQSLYYYNENKKPNDVKNETINDIVYNDDIYDNPINTNENSADNTGGETDKLNNREYYDDIYNDVPNGNKKNNNNYDYDDNKNNQNKNNNNQNQNNNNQVDNSDKGCANPMNEYDFNMAAKNIEKQKFTEGKKLVAKQLIESGCLTTTQILKILNNFKLEPDRLELAKIAYAHTYDRKNFINLFSVLKLPASVEELKAAMK